uniref:Uncharacterized protein n=1 Tax=Arundo donax TaxID=35708 RepID=A0A0A9AXP7_ARUDO
MMKVQRTNNLVTQLKSHTSSHELMILALTM